VARLSQTPPQQVLRANAERYRRSAMKHEAKAAEQRRRADGLDAEYHRWQLELRQQHPQAAS
jgi:hypothetical protein